MKFRKFTAADIETPEFQQIAEMYIEYFPPEERRELDEFKRVMSRSNHFVYGAIIDDEVVGFVEFWIFQGINTTYVEHFAVLKSLRNTGIGTLMMKEATSELFFTDFIVGEVEPPERGQEAERRILFYKRLGFQLTDFDYMQPSFGHGKPPVPLRIVLYQKISHKFSNSMYERVREVIYREVYGVKE